MLLNLTNHPVETWGEEQRAEAERRWGRVVDLAFPLIPPEWDTDEALNLARTYARTCRERLAGAAEPSAVHVMGEMTFTFALVALLQREGIPCVASTTRREVTILEDGSKRSVFRFVRFRAYPQEVCAEIHR